MKKILSIVLILAVAFAGTAVAASYDSENVSILGPNMGGRGVTPVTQIVKVRYALTGDIDPTLASGDAVSWSTTSADGYSVSACVTSNDAAFAGILVCDVATADSTNVSGRGRNVGYIAVKGYVLASMTESSTVGKQVVNGIGGKCTTIDDQAIVSGTTLMVSADTGVLLKAPAAHDALCPVWLN